MKKVNTKRSILTVTIIAAVLLAFSVNVNANSSTQDFGTQVYSEIIDVDGDLKCGEAEGKTDVKSDKKAKSTESKCGEGKCGEAEGKTDVKSDKKAKSTESKCGEGKCGEGKCGTDDAKKSDKKEAKSDKKSKSTEAKCGEGKCGEGK